MAQTYQEKMAEFMRIKNANDWTKNFGSGSRSNVVGNNGNQATDPYQLPQQQKPMFSAQQPSTGAYQGPYTMPGGPAQISTQPGMPGMLGPRPRPMGNMPNLNQNQLNALRPGSMNNQPGMGIGSGGPSRFNQNFAQSPAGQGQLGMQQGGGLMQNPYKPRPGMAQPNQNQFMNTVW